MLLFGFFSKNNYFLVAKSSGKNNYFPEMDWKTVFFNVGRFQFQFGKIIEINNQNQFQSNAESLGGIAYSQLFQGKYSSSQIFYSMAIWDKTIFILYIIKGIAFQKKTS